MGSKASPSGFRLTLALRGSDAGDVLEAPFYWHWYGSAREIESRRHWRLWRNLVSVSDQGRLEESSREKQSILSSDRWHGCCYVPQF